MSIKALREVVYQYWDSHREDGSALADDAKAELETIENAAQAWAEAPTGAAPKEVHDLMWAIIREKRR